MYCMKCGGELIENAKFCLNCGASAEQTAPVSEHTVSEANTSAPVQSAPAVQDIPAAVNVPVTELALTCPKCFAAMPGGAKMCGICGGSLVEPEPVTTRLPAEPAPHFQPVDRAALMQYTIPDADAPAEVKPRAANSKRNIIITVVALAVVIVGVVFAVFALGSGESGDAADSIEDKQSSFSCSITADSGGGSGCVFYAVPLRNSSGGADRRGEGI